MATLALALDRRTEDRLLADIVEYGHTVVARADAAQALLQALCRADDPIRPEIVIVRARRTLLTPELIAACDERGIRVLALASGAQDRRNAAALGLYEVLDESTAWPQIEAVLRAGVVVPPRVGGPQRSAALPGTVITVWGPAGAPGRTTLAINIAAEIAAAGHTVVLADVDTYSGSIAPSLGMLDEAPGFAAACRLAGSDSLTPAELERIAQRYNSPRGAFWVLTGLGRPSRWPELSAERVTRTIDALRHFADYTVIDAGFNLESDEEISSDLFAPRRNAATLTALKSADHVVACGVADPVGLARFLRAWVELTEVVADARVSVVMNRVRASAIGLNPHGQVVAALRRFGAIDDPVLVPHDQAGTDAAVLTGRTLRDAAPKSPARASIRRFVQAQLLRPTTPTAQVARTRSLGWRRVFAVRANAART
ncbi:regulator [Cryobacterium frigoriphilum]|uniref:Regulator n=1 Tax=Cryobacterium frigoriphilum TaxID=1259150 RepID=A0A4R8ZZ45_9MICO|nr:regulator [Cryobacterium frigoriphilum]TFD48989.1 regulator [Cryobacterium frigoriphilum]